MNKLTHRVVTGVVYVLRGFSGAEQGFLEHVIGSSVEAVDLVQALLHQEILSLYAEIHEL